MTTTHSDPEVVQARPDARPGVVTRVTQILDVFFMGPERMLLNDVAKATGLPRSTASRILGQLVDRQWLEHDAHGYRLAPRVRGVASPGGDHGDLRRAAATALNDLHLATGAVAHLSVLEGMRVHYLDKIGGAAAASVPSGVGTRVLADLTVSGRTLLACLAPEYVDRLMAFAAGPQHGGGRDLARLHGHLNWIRRRRGLAFVDAARCPLGIGAVAAPIIGPDGAVAAISVAGPELRPESAAPVLASAAHRTARLLFPRWPGAGRWPAASRPTRAGGEWPAPLPRAR
ncbi:IclR family transcriptional regulator [Streptosporangium carneum]|uniref:Transcriptional regulator, IclR family protein n=1 Tax=Streptosporangium carneum TaxID=47481 RepID=A0A9W6MFT9_9ACTN|nr:helix-turn-helix domain-containing protein [Streptosporangium carneum]GLK12611.1 putative transcriptional regulator, IclR family protein [Streptosporangium carneum]